MVPGTSMRNSAHGKGHEEGGFGIRKGRIKPQETPCSPFRIILDPPGLDPGSVDL